MEIKDTFKIPFHLQASTPCQVILSFQFWIATPKGKFCMLKIFWLNIWMTSSKCMVDQFLSLVFIKVTIGKHCSSFTKLITCATSSINLMYSRIFYSRIRDKKWVLHNLVSRSSSNGFYITNLALFFMVRTNKKKYRSRAMAENSLGTHISLAPPPS